MANYAAHISARQTPQTQPIFGSNQVQNDAGGFSFQVSDWMRFRRFLLLGSEGGCYYTGEKKLTIDNAQAVQRCLVEDAARAVAMIVEISKAGRAPKNDPAIFALALAFQSTNAEARPLAEAAIPEVCRIGTHMFQLNEAIKQLDCRNKAVNRGTRNWYLSQETGQLAFQVTKYQQRNGWSHRDVLRLVRPKATGTRQDLFHWIVRGWPGVGDQPHPEKDLLPVWAMERAKRATSAQEVCRLIRDYGLVRECIPTQFLTEASVWEALLEKMPLTALVRNLATMTRVGLLVPMSAATQKITTALADADHIKKSRLHPIAILSALRTYAQGHGERGSNTWTPVAQVIDALDRAFYLAYGNVEPTGKRIRIGLDVSGSMNGTQVVGLPNMSAVEAEAAMALVTAAVEPNYDIVAFDTAIKSVALSPRMRLDDATRTVAGMIHGGTDCALPIVDALQRKITVDLFVVYTDSASWAGSCHPEEALGNYRKKMSIPAKLVVVALTANEYSIGSENDVGILNVAGMDTSVPVIINDFVTS